MLEGVCWEMSGDVWLRLCEAHSGAEGSVAVPELVPQ